MSPPVKDGLMQESAFPLIIFIVGTPIALLLLIEAVLKIRKELASEKKVERKKIGKKPLFIIAISVMLALGLETVGFLVVAPIFVFLFMQIYDDNVKGIRKKLLFTLAVSAFVFVLYTVVFDIRFPLFWSIL
jgi:putative tricarboxylic transport membrane protein